jgi:cell division protein FtsQ
LKNGGFLTKDGSSVLEAPATGSVSKTTAGAPRRVPGAPSLRRDLSDDFARDFGDDDEGYAPKRYKGVRFRFKGAVPKSIVGRVVAGGVLVAMLAGFTAALWEARSVLMHDPRLVIASSAGVQIEGNSHMTRPQLLSVFGGDVDRNILTVPLTERRAELEQLPWVQHATVMRLLPNKLRVKIVERTPVAFVRQSGTIGLVDANGILLDMSADAPVAEHYSFPVVTGVSAGDPLSVRAARMKVYLRFMEDMGAASNDLSEVDLSDPEDVKALVPSGSSDILVHFGDDNFLHRYKTYTQHLAEWKSANPRLASVDMRYEHQVVLEMAKPTAGAAAEDGAEASTSPKREVGQPAIVAAPKPPVVKAAKTPVVKAPVTEKAVAPTAVAPVAAPPVATPSKGHLQTAFDVPAKSTPKQAGPPK